MPLTDVDPDTFWSYVEPRGDCWEWLGSKDKGYGLFRVPDGTAHGLTRRAHRIAYELLVGPIPAGLFLDHVCRNRGCVNPDHLQPVTPGENTRRSPLRSAGVYCRHGHVLEGNNVRIRTHKTRGLRERICVACARAYGAAWVRQKRGARASIAA